MASEVLDRSNAFDQLLASWFDHGVVEGGVADDGGDRCEIAEHMTEALLAGQGWWTRVPRIMDAAACGCHGCDCEPSRGYGEPDRPRRLPAPYVGEPPLLDGGEGYLRALHGCPTDSRRFTPPRLFNARDWPAGPMDIAVNEYVAEDIAGEFGITLPPPAGTLMVDLPDVGCCPPFVAPRACALPPRPYAGLDVRDAELGDITPGEPVCDPADVDAVEELVSAAISFLRENLDLAEWALCLVAGYHPRGVDPGIDANLDSLVQGVSDMIQGNPPTPMWPNWSQLPGFNWPPAPEWTVTVHGWKWTFVEGASYAEPASSVPYTDPNADGTVGVNVYAYATRMQNWLASFQSADVAVQVCGVAGCAGTMLHELTHVWAKLDDYGGTGINFGHHTWYPEELGRPEPWDTARMAKGAFLWAVAQRYAACGNTVYATNEFLTSGLLPGDLRVERSDAYPCTNPATGAFQAYPCTISPPVDPEAPQAAAAPFALVAPF
jgi:hypothetical protein